MALGSSASIRPLTADTHTACRLAAVKPPIPLLSRINLRDCVQNLRRHGYQDFQLNTSAHGRFVYKEPRKGSKLEGVYLGFALRKNNSDQFVIHGRVVFSPQDFPEGRCFSGGYHLIEILEPKTACAELHNDRSTPMLVSEAIREGYRGIGTVLIDVLKELTRQDGLAGIRILLSLSPESDKFYQSCGFEPLGNCQWQFKLKQNSVRTLFLADGIKPRHQGINADWRPAEVSGSQFTQPSPPWHQRILRALFSSFNQKTVAADALAENI